jgi:formate dehydrogenase subunit delta
MKPEKLVMMANQIGVFFASQKGDAAVQGILDHIKKFWDPRMRSAILAHLDAGGVGPQSAQRRRTAIPRAKGNSEELAWRHPSTGSDEASTGS